MLFTIIKNYKNSCVVKISINEMLYWQVFHPLKYILTSKIKENHILNSEKNLQKETILTLAYPQANKKC